MQLEPAVALDGLEPGRDDVPSNLFERRAAAAFAGFVLRRHAIDIVGADGERDLCELRTVERPVHLDRRDVVDNQPRQGDGLHVLEPCRGCGRVDAPRERRERADDGDGALQVGHRLQQRHRIGRRNLLHRQPREREAGDVDLLDRAPRILKPVHRRFGNELEPGRAQFLEQRPERDAFAAGQQLEVGEREGGHGRTRRRSGHFTHALHCRRTAFRHPDDSQLARGWRTDHRRAGLGRRRRYAHERRPGAVALPPEIVGEHPDADDVVRGRETGEFRGGDHECSTLML